MIYLGSIALNLDEIDFTNVQFIENECTFCEDGLQPTITNKDFVDQIFDIRIEIKKVVASFNIPMDDTTFNPSIAQLKLKSCDPGFGIASDSSVFDCNECLFNQFSLRPDVSSCIDCSTVNQNGLECQGGNHTIVTFNWWVAVLDKNENEIKDFYDIQWYDDNDRRRLQVSQITNDSDTDTVTHSSLILQDDEIIVALCPPKYCCQSVGGCDYLSMYLKDENSDNGAVDVGLCAPGRDISGMSMQINPKLANVRCYDVYI